MIQLEDVRYRLFVVPLMASALAPWISPWLSPIVVAALGLLVLLVWARRIAVDDPRLVWLMSGVFLLHVTLGAALFLISYFHLPVLRSLQLGGGFWAFAGDSDGYHLGALHLIDDLKLGRPLPTLTAAVAYDSFLAVVYMCFGSLPLTAIVINGWFVAASGLFAYLLARQFGAARGAQYAAVLVVTCWPSGFVWSSQLLRDSMALFLTWASLSAIVFMLEALPGRSVTTLLRAAALAGTTAAVTIIRIQVGWLFLAAAIAVVMATGAGLVRTTRGMRNAFAVLLLVAVATVFGTGVPYMRGFQVEVKGAATLKPVPPPSSPGPTPEAAGADNPITTATESQRSSPAATSPVATSPSAAFASRLDTIPRLLESRRRAYLIGANASIGADADVMTWHGLFAFLPEAVANGLFAPFPWDWRSGKTTGAMKSLGVVEGLALMVLFPVLALGLVRAAKARRSGITFVLVYGTVALVFISLLVPSLGTLVRQRLQALLPLFVLAIAAGGLDVYQKLIEVAWTSRRSSLLTERPDVRP